MAQRFWPEGKQPVTPPPAIQRDGESVALDCPDEAASMGYQVGDGPWRVYAGPFRAPRSAAVSARAVRYGWQASDVVVDPPTP